MRPWVPSPPASLLHPTPCLSLLPDPLQATRLRKIIALNCRPNLISLSIEQAARSAETWGGVMSARARLKTALSQRFGIDVPIFGFSHSVAVTAAISNAGGLGVYGATRDTPEEIRSRL